MLARRCSTSRTGKFGKAFILNEMDKSIFILTNHSKWLKYELNREVGGRASQDDQEVHS